MMQACRLAGRTARKHARAMNRCALIYLGLMTLWCALCAALGGLPGSVRMMTMGYLYGVIGLGMNAVLMSAVSRQANEICLNARGWALLFALPLMYLVPLACVEALWKYVNGHWQTLAVYALSPGWRRAAMLAAAGGMLCAILWLFCAIGAFVRLAFLHALRGGEPLERQSACRLAGKALRHSLAPAALALRHAPVFLLAAVLWAALEVGAGLLTGTFAWKTDAGSTALSFLLHLLTQNRWLFAAIFAAGPLWMLGLGVRFWPRYQLEKVCYFYRAD